MIQNKEATIKNSAGVDIHVISSSFPARQKLAVRARLFCIIAPFLSAISKEDIALLKSDTLLDDPKVISKFLPALQQVLSSTDIVDLILTLLTFTRVNGLEVSQGVIFDTVFDNEDILLFKVLRFVIVDVNRFLSMTKAGENTIGAPSLQEKPQTRQEL